MIQNEKNFVKESRTRLEELIISYFENEDVEENKINELKTYYKFLIVNPIISNNNKIIYLQFFLETISMYVKKWLVNFLTASVLKIYKNEINKDLLVNNDYFTFRLLANKEIIKDLLSKYINLIDLHFSMMYFISFEKETKNFFKDLPKIGKYIKDFLNKKNIKTMYYSDGENLNFYFELKKQLMLNEDEYINYLNNKYLFEMIDDKIFFNHEIIDFFDLFFNVKTDYLELKLKSNSEEEIRKEISDAISLLTF